MARRSTTGARGDPPISGTVARTGWAERVADRSPVVQRSKEKSVDQARSIVSAAQRLIDAKGPTFTTQELIKEAGIALQTFYRYFSGKDALLLAVIEDLIEENCRAFRQHADSIADPVDRLRYYVTTTVHGLSGPGSGPSFITAEHFRLQTQYPAEVSQATQPYTDLLIDGINAAVSAGRLHPPDAEYSAWLITQLVMAVFHHYDCAGVDEPTDVIAQRLWTFCFAALEGSEHQG
ncbi:MAG TPA: TetR/AcrR family transcriptional regulator [Acidimicrobiales bacterium]|jgi:TetR/AcrR family transcriptional regulator|nr:TetR/AcrR family transcriptional regulator [Acidimicrobiales bacterium]